MTFILLLSIKIHNCNIIMNLIMYDFIVNTQFSSIQMNAIKHNSHKYIYKIFTGNVRI